MTWNPNDHPRDADGKFRSKGGPVRGTQRRLLAAMRADPELDELLNLEADEIGADRARYKDDQFRNANPERWAAFPSRPYTADEEEAFLQGISVAELRRRRQARAQRGGLAGARREGARQLRETFNRLVGRS